MVAILALVLAAPGVARAEAEEAPAAPMVDLDRLLQLPDSYRERVQGSPGRAHGPDVWRLRFAAADRAVSEARQDLANAQAALGKLAGETSDWQLSAPGLAAGGDRENSPLSFRLREQIRKRKQELQDAERGRLDLEVEANLAGVPKGWREAPSVPKTDAGGEGAR